MRRITLILGVGVLAGAWGGLAHLAERAFFAHMIMHMAVVAVAAPCLAYGMTGGGLDPVRRWPRLFEPVPLSILELVIVWAWHAPLLHHLARHTWYGFMAEQGMFLLVGVLLWLSAFGGEPDLRRVRAGNGVVGLLITSMHMTLLGALLALTPRPLYVHHAGFGSMSALADQQLGGAIMILVGGAVYLGGGLWLTLRILRVRAEEVRV